MAHLRLAKLPATALPVGATSSTDGGDVLVEGPDRAALCAWQLEALKAGELTHDDLRGGGEGAPTRATVEVPRAQLDALLNLSSSATKAQFVAARDALSAASRSS